MSTREFQRQQPQPLSPCWCDVAGSLLHSNVDSVLTYVNNSLYGYDIRVSEASVLAANSD
jgi:hypothetical protein